MSRLESPLERLHAHNVEFEKTVFRPHERVAVAVGYSASNVSMLIGDFPLLGGLGYLLRGEAQDGTVQDRLAVEWPVGAQRIEFIIQRSAAFPCPQREIDALGSVGFGGRTAFQRRGQTFGRWIAATIQDVQGLEGRPAPVFGHSHRNAPMVDKTPVTATMAS